MTRIEFDQLIARNDTVGMHAIGRALVHLLNRQTNDEQQCATTKLHNNIGFTVADARRGTLAAKHYIKRGYLADWQVEFWGRRLNKNGRTRIGKYYTQISAEVKKKQIKKLATKHLTAA
jgi:hypothetical protein